MTDRHNRARSKLPYDVRQECLWIARGYERRAVAYARQRRDVLDGGGAIQLTGTPRGSGISRDVEARQAKLEEIEQAPETTRMRAVEYARGRVGLDLPAGVRAKLREGIMLNCIDRKAYPYSRLDVPTVGQKEFYRHKNLFLEDIAAYLGIF